jgi:hypothetical protein
MRPAPSLLLLSARASRRLAMLTPNAAMRSVLGSTSKVSTSPPRALTSATPAIVRSSGRMVQSSTRRLSAKEKFSPSTVNMYSSDSGVVMGAKPPLTPAGKSPITPFKRSDTCWRAQ